MEPCFLGDGWTPAGPWGLGDEFLVLLCLYVLLYHLLNCLYPPKKISHFYPCDSLPPLTGAGTWVRGCTGLSCHLRSNHNVTCLWWSPASAGGCRCQIIVLGAATWITVPPAFPVLLITAVSGCEIIWGEFEASGHCTSLINIWSWYGRMHLIFLGPYLEIFLVCQLCGIRRLESYRLLVVISTPNSNSTQIHMREKT